MASTTHTPHPAQHLASRHPRGLRATWCDCGQPVLQGLDEDDCAMTVRADPQPTTTLGEAIARMDGRNTYDLRNINGTFQLMRRNPLTIISRPPQSRIWCSRIDVLAEHRCGSDPLPTLDTVHPAPQPTTRNGGPDDCPF